MESMKDGNCLGNKSYAAVRRAEAEIIDGLNSSSLISALFLKIIITKSTCLNNFIINETMLEN